MTKILLVTLQIEMQIVNGDLCDRGSIAEIDLSIFQNFFLKS